MPKPPKRPRDMMQLAKMVGELATGQATEDSGPKKKTARPAKRIKHKKKG